MIMKKSAKVSQNLSILLFVSSSRRSAPEIAEELDISYITALKRLDAWTAEGMLKKHELEKVERYQHKYEYELTTEGEQFLQEIHRKLAERYGDHPPEEQEEVNSSRDNLS